MAYDPKDANDKKTVDALIKAAVDAALEEQSQEHDAAASGLKIKNAELITRIKKLREGQGNSDPEAQERLETQLADTKEKLAKIEKDYSKTVKERDTLKVRADEGEGKLKRVVMENGLTEGLLSVNVGKNFIPAVKSLLGSKATVDFDGDKPSISLDGKPLGDFLKAWSQGDEGKSFIAVPASGGAGASGAKGNGSEGGAKQISRTEFDALSQIDRATFAKAGGKVIQT